MNLKSVLFCAMLVLMMSLNTVNIQTDALDYLGQTIDGSELTNEIESVGTYQSVAKVHILHQGVVRSQKARQLLRQAVRCKISQTAELRIRLHRKTKRGKRTYTVCFNHVVRTVSDTTCLDFEHFSLNAGKNYYVWQRVMDDGSLKSDWASGNGGFILSMNSAKPEEYPTIPLMEGFDGKAVQLTTRSTGAFGVWANKRIAAGNLFLGTFVVDSALQSPMKATNFGVVYDSKPIKMTGYYKYAPGKNYQDRKGNILKKHDRQRSGLCGILQKPRCRRESRNPVR